MEDSRSCSPSYRNLGLALRMACATRGGRHLPILSFARKPGLRALCYCTYLGARMSKWITFVRMARATHRRNLRYAYNRTRRQLLLGAARGLYSAMSHATQTMYSAVKSVSLSLPQPRILYFKGHVGTMTTHGDNNRITTAAARALTRPGSNIDTASLSTDPRK